MPKPDAPSTASTNRHHPYHHGNLRHALIAAGMDLVREGGPEALGLREVARRVGVSPTSAYRHFADHADLILAVKHRALDGLTTMFEQELATTDSEPDTAEAVLARLHAIGERYVRFARNEPGLYMLALAHREIERPAFTGAFQVASFEILTAMLDQLVRFAWLAPDRRPGAEIRVWAALHGLAMLMIAGPLMPMPEPEKDAMTEQMLEMIVRGL